MTDADVAISNHSFAAPNLKTILSWENEEGLWLVLEASPDEFVVLCSIRDESGVITDFRVDDSNSTAA
jgi:hypothetical protein